MDKRYQIFISSTFADLREERGRVQQAVLELNCIPAGMELYPVIDNDQFEFTKKVIDDCDYYLLIIGGRYGSLSNEGVSYTEMEYNYAISKGLKVIAFLHSDPDSLPAGKSERDASAREKLRAFRNTASTGRFVRFWKEASELPGLVLSGLIATVRTYPAIGWIRANSVQDSQSYEEIKSKNIIERSLEFAPEYTQAGISILSYFGEVLRLKYPGLNVKVRIEQQATTVLMHVELPSGNIDTIREELATYFMVVAGKEKPEALLSNPLHLMAMENKLQMANMELRMSQQLNAHLANEISNLQALQQRMEHTFKAQIAEQGTQIRTLISLAAQQSVSHERVQMAQIGHHSTVFQEIVSGAQGNQAILTAIRSLEHNLMSGIALIDVQDQISSSLATINQEKPSLLKHLVGQIEGAGFGAAGGFVLDWISKHA